MSSARLTLFALAASSSSAPMASTVAFTPTQVSSSRTSCPTSFNPRTSVSTFSSALQSSTHSYKTYNPLNPNDLDNLSSNHLSESELNQDQASALLTFAKLCASSDSCSLESAQWYLKEIVHIQSGCAAGTLAGELVYGEVCDDVLGVSEVVAGLREKIRVGGEGLKEEVKSFWDKREEEFKNLVLASGGMSSIESWKNSPLKPGYLALAALYTIMVINFLSFVFPDASGVEGSGLGGGVVPFTAQEVWWAIRGGYVGDLVSHLVRNGGLVVGDVSGVDASSLVTSSMTPLLTAQEIWWSIRDGYFADTLFSDNGGNIVGSLRDVGSSVPIKPQEVWWAIRDGYAADMMEHVWRNGGL